METAALFSGIFGIILAILLVFISIVWLIFPFIVMSRMRGIREEIEKGNHSTLSLLQEIAKGNHFLDKIATSTAPKILPPQPKGGAHKFNISKGGEDLGPMDIAKVKYMLRAGQLNLTDHYFDSDANEWMTLDCHPDFC